jgi:hypothetical protein
MTDGATVSDRSDQPERLYGLLGITDESSFAEVKRAFRFAIPANHPDRNPDDPFAAQRLTSISAGWELVNTPQKWDAYRRRPTAASSASSSRTPPPTPRRPPAAPWPILRLERAVAAMGGAARWKVWLDGRVAAKLAVGRSVELQLQPGAHQLCVTYGLTNRSRVVTLDLAAGEHATFRCAPAWSLRQAVKLQRIP